jgi:hypothetical protein
MTEREHLYSCPYCNHCDPETCDFYDEKHDWCDYHAQEDEDSRREDEATE